MPVAKCVCVFEEVKSKVASSVREFANFASSEGLNVIKRNKDLKSGDFIVFAPSHRTQGDSEEDCKSRHVCYDDSFSKAANVNFSAESKDGSGLFLEIPMTIESTWEVERGKYLVKLSRPSLYGKVLRQVLFAEQGICDRCAIVRDGLAIVNCTLLNDTKGTDCDQLSLTLDQLRLLMVSEHVGNLLLNNGFSVTYTQYPVMEYAYNFMNKHFGTYAKLNTVEEDFASNISSSAPECMSSTGCKSASIGCEEVLEKYRNSPYATEIDCTELMLRDEDQGDQQSKVALDLKRFISDNFSSSEMLQNTYQKNFSKVQFDCSSSLVCQIDRLEYQRSRLEQFVQEKRSVDCSDAQRMMLCVHVTSYEQEFKQQQVATAWHILEPKVAVIKQVHVVCGPVSSRNGIKPIMSAQDYFKLKHDQMTDAFIMKYGNELQGEEWRDNVLQLTKAAVRFDLLSTVSRQQVKLDFSVETSNGDNKGGVFVMYNFARLSTLFCHFEDAVRKGTYPGLPTTDFVDFSTLKQEEEWGLLFNYILLYPSILRETVAGLKQSPGSIQVHKICQFLLSLSNSLSSYYSKTHILCEPRPHLMPVMFARLYLMKAIRKVMHECLNLLAIDPCTQL